MTPDAGPAPRPAIIIVGVDGSSRGQAALAFALDEAVRSGDTVEMVTAWGIDVEGAPMFPIYVESATGDPEQDAKYIQDDAITAVLKDREPPVPIARTVVRGVPGQVLVEAAEHARLLVVGSRGFGPVRAALLGSVSRYCAQHSTDCPVVVVPSDGHHHGKDGVHDDLAVTAP
jgi:nucleotide-binding universal stress UspA family protein